MSEKTAMGSAESAASSPGEGSSDPPPFTMMQIERIRKMSNNLDEANDIADRFEKEHPDIVRRWCQTTYAVGK